MSLKYLVLWVDNQFHSQFINSSPYVYICWNTQGDLMCRYREKYRLDKTSKQYIKKREIIFLKQVIME